jgi:hypothetical protein
MAKARGGLCVKASTAFSFRIGAEGGNGVSEALRPAGGRFLDGTLTRAHETLTHS